MLLALDTSTHLASLAICENGELRAEYTWDVGSSHSVELLRRLESLVKERGIALAQISAVATAIGPGSFTGVRVAVTVAKSLAFSLHVPLVGVSTLDVIGYSQAGAVFPVCALMDAGRGEFYAALYHQMSLSETAVSMREQEASRRGVWAARLFPAGNLLRRDGLYWERQGEYQLVTAEELAQVITQPTLLCGDLPVNARSKLAEAVGTMALFVPSLACARRAGLLAELAAQRLECGVVDDPLTLEPLYLRRPNITVSTRNRPQLLGQHERPGEAADRAGSDGERSGDAGSGEQKQRGGHAFASGGDYSRLDAPDGGSGSVERWAR